MSGSARVSFSGARDLSVSVHVAQEGGRCRRRRSVRVPGRGRDGEARRRQEHGLVDPPLGLGDRHAGGSVRGAGAAVSGRWRRPSLGRVAAARRGMGSVPGGSRYAVAGPLAVGELSENGATTWWWVFNQYPGTIFTRADIQEALETLGAQSGWTRVTSASLKRDIDVFIRMYAPQRRRNGLLEDTLDCPLVELGLIHASRQQQTLTLVRSEHESLPDEIFAYALTEYLHSRAAPDTDRHARRAVVRRRCAGSCVLPGRARTARSARPHRGTDGRRRGIRRNRGSEAGVRAWCTGSRDVSESVL